MTDSELVYELRMHSDNVVAYNNAKNQLTGAYLNSGTCTFSLADVNGVGVAGATDIAMPYVTASNGNYRGILESTVGLIAGAKYTLVIDFVQGDIVDQVTINCVTVPAVVAPAALTTTYDYLRREIGRFLGYGRDPNEWANGSDEAIDVEDILRSGVRRVVTPPPLQNERYGHEWSFLSPSTTLTTTAPYTTGTVTIAAGVATLVGGTWPSWATQGMLTIAAGTYAVVTRTSGSQIVLSDTTATLATASTFSLGRAVYDLPSDFAMIDGPLIYAAGQSLLQQPIQRVSEHELLNELQFTLLSYYPRKYAIRPKSINMTTTTRYELLLSPTPDAIYSLYYNYKVGIPVLDGTNTTPPGGDSHGELYLEACLAAAEQKLHDTQGLHSARFMECLAASVSHDRKLATPATMGFNRERSDLRGIDWDDHRRTFNGTVTYHGYPP